MKRTIGANHIALHEITKEKLKVTFSATGDIHTIHQGGLLLNQLIGQELDGGLTNIYLRMFEADTIQYYPLIGKNTTLSFYLGQSQVLWTGQIQGIYYQVQLKLAENMLFWNVNLEGQKEKVDLVFAADLGLADEGALRSNEAYNAQYINHHILQSPHFAISSRQGQKQTTGFPTLETGAFGQYPLDGYLTDGFQFFGKSFKASRRPEALLTEAFPNEIYQYEMAYLGLKSEAFQLEGSAQMTFYQHVQVSTSDLAEKTLDPELLKQIYDELPDETLNEMKLSVAKIDLSQQINGQLLSNEAIKAKYEPIKFEENIDGQLASGFTTDNVHFVSQSKELLLEREHGEIFLSGQSKSIKDRGLATSSFIYGLFNAHVVIGNTTMNKLLTNQRDHLNLIQATGQRIYLKINGKYQMLGIPSLFEMGYNFAKWTYVLEDDTIIVTNFVASNEKSIQLEVSSNSGRDYDYLITNQVVMDANEYQSQAQMTTLSEQSYDFTAGQGSAINAGNKNLTYRMTFDKAVHVMPLGSLFEGPTFIENSLVIYKLSGNHFRLKISASLEGQIPDSDFLDFESEASNYQSFIEKDLLSNFKFKSDAESFEKINTILPWYAHDMLVHYLSPHGLEQYGGAAWGTRDVSQGPIEFFLSTQHFDVAREILLTLFSHQFEDGTWPQWFMFDEYQEVYADESHGDVVVWPMLALGQYLEQTGDTSILEDKVPFMSRETRHFIDEATIATHVERELAYIKNNFLPGTYLSAYGDGDWDDTLQPANANLKKNMTSSWTNALTYQTFIKYSAAVETVHPELKSELIDLAEKIKTDFEKYLIIDGVLAGFALQKADGRFEPIIHPNDTRTKMKYRFLPMNRSIISELASQEQLTRNLAIINNELTFNDGIRLMERPPVYKGGINSNFKRAEQAANFGREIGLLYIHAQIRYVEAMAKINHGPAAWKALEQTLPTGIQEVVNNAAPRQANVYFSSSDGDFKNRYEAQENFDKLKTGKVKVKGGWRLYSSGPGIVTNQVISHLAGLKASKDGLILNPTFPEGQDEFTIESQYAGKVLTITYQRSGDDKIICDGQVIVARKLENPYSHVGLLIEEAQLAAIKSGSHLNIHIAQ